LTVQVSGHGVSIERLATVVPDELKEVDTSQNKVETLRGEEWAYHERDRRRM